MLCSAQIRSGTVMMIFRADHISPKDDDDNSIFSLEAVSLSLSLDFRLKINELNRDCPENVIQHAEDGKEKSFFLCLFLLFPGLNRLKKGNKQFSGIVNHLLRSLREKSLLFGCSKETNKVRHIFRLFHL